MHYVYISPSKLSYLFPQVPSSFLRSLDTELKVNAGIVSATLSGKSNEREEGDAIKVSLLASYIESAESVGTIHEPGKYIKGEFSLRYGAIADHWDPLAFFGGVVEGINLGLIGSAGSLVGAAKVSEDQYNHGLGYYTNQFLMIGVYRGGYLDKIEHQGLPVSSFWEAIDLALKSLPPVESRVKFLAKTLHVEPGIVVATPIYVALAD